MSIILSATVTPTRVGQPEQPCLPTLDLPPARFSASLAGGHLQGAGLAAGARLGCWVLSNPADPSWLAGRTLHFGAELEATDWREDLIGRLTPGEEPPELSVAQAARPCFTASCAVCGNELGAETPTVRAVHHPTLVSLDDDARSQGWSTDGLAWFCSHCPSPERSRW